MTLQDVRYTRKDYDEASRAVRSHSSRGTGWVWAVALFAVIGLAEFVAPFAQVFVRGGGTVNVCGATVTGGTYLLCAALLYCFLIRSTSRAVGMVPPPPRPPAAWQATNGVLCVVVFLTIVGAAAFSPPEPAPPPPPNNEPASAGLLPLLPWVVIFLVLWVFVFQMFRSVTTTAWSRQTDMHLPHTFHISDQGIAIQDPTAERRFTWAAFVGWQETTNLFILLRSHITFIMVPKRSFPTPPAADYFYALIRQQIGSPAHNFAPLQPPPHQ